LFAAPAFATPGQSITTIAGNGTAGSTGDGGPAVNAELKTPTGVAADLTGNLYIADTSNNKVRKVVNPTTIKVDTISTFAGTGSSGFSGDGGPATSAKLSSPSGLAVDSHGDVFIADSGNNRVREVLPTGIIRTFAGSGACGDHTSLGNGLPAVQASLCSPTGVAVSGTNVYISDSGHFEVRVVNAAGVISAFAGTASYGYSGDGGPATSAKLGVPTGLAVDAAHDVYIADSANTVVRKVNSAGTISTFAGTGKFGFSGDGGPATNAKLSAPTGLAVDQTGDVFIADTLNNRLREVNGSGIITTIAGTGQYGFSGDGGPATSAKLAIPTGTVAWTGTALFFSDTGNQRVRGVFNGPPPVLPETSLVILLPLGALALGGGAFLVLRRRRRINPLTV
jgi:hypothetical protein